MFDYRTLATPEEEEWFSKLSLEEKAKINYDTNVAPLSKDAFVQLSYDTLPDEARKIAIEGFKKIVEMDGMPTLASIRFEKWLRDNCNNCSLDSDIFN